MVNSTTAALLDSLNAQQREAVLNTRGPMLVLAGAGTGKTTVITRRIAQLLASGVKPKEILAVTFTKKAATEMKERVQTLLGETLRELTVCTFHALGYRILHNNRIATNSRGKLNLIPAKQQQEIVEAALVSSELIEQYGVREGIREIARVRAISALGSADGQLGDSQRLVAAYEAELRRRQQVDFDDLLVLPVRHLRESCEFRDLYRNRWKYVLVDEYQDTNELQHCLVRFLIGAERNLCIVGDDDQSIYGFRGASAEKMLEFGNEFPGSRLVKLEQNYRSGGKIIRLANSVIERSSKRYRKTLRPQVNFAGRVTHEVVEDDQAESSRIADCIQTRGKTRRWGDMAVLFRVTADAWQLKNQLDQRKIPYQSSGQADSTKAGVAIMTLHRSKGLEFPIVFLPAVEEDTLPHYHATCIEEERRLLYVGITRARKELLISSSENRRGRPKTTSRFLADLSMH